MWRCSRQEQRRFVIGEELLLERLGLDTNWRAERSHLSYLDARAGEWPETREWRESSESAYLHDTTRRDSPLRLTALETESARVESIGDRAESGESDDNFAMEFRPILL